MFYRSIFLLFFSALLFSCNKKTTTNEEVTKYHEHYTLDFKDSTDFENAKRGYIATTNDTLIKNKEGKVIQNINSFAFVKTADTSKVNKSLARQSLLNSMHGLYKVTDGIYQVRGFDLANVSFIESENGWIVVDPLTSVESMALAKAVVDKELGVKKIKAIIITHSHIDHFGGVGALGVGDDVEIITPKGFFEHAISENINAGNAMTRRALYMYGMLLPKNEEGSVGSGLGNILVRSHHSIKKPTLEIEDPFEKHIIDGVEIIFQNTPGAEAPAEFMFYLPQKRAFCQAEQINHVMHNLYTLRGAQVRDGLKWSKYIDDALVHFGDRTEVSFGSHHWPTWGNAEIKSFWEDQRNLYRFIHDQTLRLANHGHNPVEIAEMLQLPEKTAKFFGNRGYYGSLNHNIKAQYQLYFGWFDGNPANLHKLPPKEESIKYLEYMGGSEKVLKMAKIDYNEGNYRWVATTLNHVVFVEKENKEARELLAKTYTQMGYRSENATWRNFYLTAAKELLEKKQQRIVSPNGISGSPDLLTQMSLESYFDFMAIRLNPEKSAGKQAIFNFEFIDTQEKIALHLKNGVLINRPNSVAPDPTASLELTKEVLDDIITNRTSFEDAIADQKILVEGDKNAFLELLGMLDTFNLLFPIIED